MTFLAANVAGVRSQLAHSQVFFPLLRAYGIVIIVTLVPSVVSFLREIPLLALADRIPLSLVLPGLFGTLGQIASLTLLVYFLVRFWL